MKIDTYEIYKCKPDQFRWTYVGKTPIKDQAERIQAEIIKAGFRVVIEPKYIR